MSWTVGLLETKVNLRLICTVDTFDESGEKVAYTQLAGFVVGAGGFGGKRDSPKAVPTANKPSRRADFSTKHKVDPSLVSLEPAELTRS